MPPIRCPARSELGLMACACNPSNGSRDRSSRSSSSGGTCETLLQGGGRIIRVYVLNLETYTSLGVPALATHPNTESIALSLMFWILTLIGCRDSHSKWLQSQLDIRANSRPLTTLTCVLNWHISLEATLKMGIYPRDAQSCTRICAQICS